MENLTNTLQSGVFVGPPAAGDAGVIYKVNSSKASFGELWRDVRSPMILISWILKILGVRLPGSVNDPNVAALAPFEVQPAALPAQARGRFATGVAELKAVGFDELIAGCYLITDIYNNSRTSFALLGRADGRAIARVVLRTEGTGNPPKTHSFVEIISGFSDGSYLVTTSARAYLNAPPGISLQPDVGAAPARLWAKHEAALRSRTTAAAVSPATPPYGARSLIEKYHDLVRDNLLMRGVFQAMDERDAVQSQHLQEIDQSSREQGFEYPEVMVEIERLQTRKSSWAGAVFLLALTLFLFIATGGKAFNGDWQFIVMLIPILFFHELGHYLSMLAFGYRNVSMFFIPFLGAAVKGSHYNVAGWKKVIVALMGPLPGIIVGAVLSIVGALLHNELVLKIAMLTLFINGFNLLPVLPLDGGRIVQTLFFSRNWMLDAVFRVIASIVLILVGMELGDHILVPLGVLLLIGILAMARVARIAVEMRKAGIGASTSDSNEIPPQAAQAIITRLKASRPRPVAKSGRQIKTTGNKLLAQQTLNVYETINARPPGALGTFALGTVHLVTLGLAIVFGIFAIFQVNPNLRAMLNSELGAPRRLIAPNEFAVAHGPAPAIVPTTSESAAARRRDRNGFVLANYTRSSSAHDAFEELRSRLGPGESAEWFGQTVFVGYRPGDDAARHRWLTTLERTSSDVFVSSITGRFLCTAKTSDAAKQTADEVEEYFSLPGAMRLIPPWTPDSAWPADQRERNRRARATLVHLISAGNEGEKPDPEARTLSEKISDAYRRGDTDEAKALGKQQLALYKQNRERDLKRIAADAESDHAVAEIYLAKFSTPPGQYEPRDGDDELDDSATTEPTTQSANTWLAKHRAYDADMARELGPMLGQLPATGPEQSDPDEIDMPRLQGMCHADGTRVTLTVWSSSDPFAQTPAVATWFWDRGCTNLRYDFGTGIRVKKTF